LLPDQSRFDGNYLCKAMSKTPGRKRFSCPEFHVRGKEISGLRILARASCASPFRKIIHTPASTKHAPKSDHKENFSPPIAHPNATAPGGVMSEIACSLATVIRGSSQ